MTDDIKCACVAIDAFHCVAIRYNRPRDCDYLMHMDDPCECPCHIGDEDDDDFAINNDPGM